MVENAFAFLKQTYRELEYKSELHVTFLLDVVVYCAILHNILLKQSYSEVERLLEMLQLEASTSGEDPNEVGPVAPVEGPEEHMDVEQAAKMRSQLGVLLTLQCFTPT